VNDVESSLRSLITVAELHDPYAADRLKRLIGYESPDAIAQNGEVWGGMGSVMDTLAVTCPSGREGRRECEAAAIRLAEALRAVGVESPMVAKWEDVFRRWRDQGI
jgi:hypothetical protein